MAEKIRIGFVGVGNISGIYLKNITELFREIEVAGVCDLIREKAEKAAQEYGIPKIYSDMYELFADPDVDIVLNITQAYNHYAVTKAALTAGKHVYSEKPLASTYEEALELCELAKSRGLLLGGAPDTFMGAGIQTARRLIDAGMIGTPLGGEARMVSHGMEVWHPDSEPFYTNAAGPMLDMGPYYATALINLLGRVNRVTGISGRFFEERTMRCGPKYGKKFPVQTQTYVNGILQFDSGAIVHLLTTFDVYHPTHSVLEIYGTEGSLFIPDPNYFSGKLLLKRGTADAAEMPMMFGYTENSRALGLADMAKSLQTGRMHRANSEQQLHVVEILTAVRDADGSAVTLRSPYTRQAPMPAGEIPGILD
ncbi:MAG: Gfo/Idh/MocA family oxidoreductase [Clostridiaceae bacterium]|nr:Gfo/Idh/MocA family oxidoreductase [Clostridiaceae bacterium]